MKKVLLLLGLIITMLRPVYAEEEIWLRKHRFPNAYGVFDGVDRVHLFYAQSYSFDGNFAFCIEPGIAISSEYYSSTIDLSMANIPGEILNKVRLIAYYGFAYGPVNHWNNNYYMATQELIWKEITGRDTYWVSEEDINGPRINVDREKQEIITAVQNHSILPSFNNQEISLKVGEEYTLIDENNVLNRFQLSDDYENIKIDGNKIIISANSVDDGGEISLISKSYTDKVSLIYYSGDSQKLMSVTGVLDPQIVKLKVRVTSEPRIKLIKIDALTKERVKLAGIKFKIKNRDTGEYICDDECTYATDDNGEFTTAHTFPEGNYQIEEVSDYVTGYFVNAEPLEFTINHDTSVVQDDNGTYIEIKYENMPIQGMIEIYKQGEEYTIQDNHFVYSFTDISDVKLSLYANEDIYLNNNLKYHKDECVATITTVDGYAFIKDIPLGNYYLKELETLSEYLLDTEKYDVSLKQDGNKQVVETIHLKNYLRKGIFELTKIDKSTSIPLEGAIISIYNQYDELIYQDATNYLGKLTIEGLPLGKYYYLESEAPHDYQIDDTKHYFELIENNQIFKANLVNERVVVPSTNLNKSNLVNILSLFLFVLGGILFGFNKG